MSSSSMATIGATSSAPVRGWAPRWRRRSMRSTHSPASDTRASCSASGSPARRDHGAVVVGVGVDVEHVHPRTPAGVDQRPDRLGVATLADVGHRVRRGERRRGRQRRVEQRRTSLCALMGLPYRSPVNHLESTPPPSPLPDAVRRQGGGHRPQRRRPHGVQRHLAIPDGPGDRRRARRTATEVRSLRSSGPSSRSSCCGWASACCGAGCRAR